MLRNNRLWNAVRSLRGKGNKGCLVYQNTLNIERENSTDEDGEQQEIETRVKLWLHESCPPRIESRPEAIPRQERTMRQPEYYEERTGLNCHEAVNIELFHPDFAEWSSIQKAETIEKRPDNLMHIIDDAAETLSKLLSAPFGTS